jgi:histidyl-tRNA synthetase
MKLDTQPYKGTRDFYPEDLKVFRWMFLKIEKVLKLYGYEEYMGPLLESVELYKAKSGDNIVKEEMYTLKDRGDRDLAIRPELTPTLARMIANRIQTIPKPIRWYSIPNLYRDEKPQRSRLKEHWQLNVDILGVNSMYAEIEIFQIIKDIYDSFNIPQSSYKIRYNSLIYL